MNKKYLLQIIIIASLAFGVFTLFVLLFLAKHHILFFTENNEYPKLVEVLTYSKIT